MQVHFLRVAVDCDFKHSLHSLITVANGFPAYFFACFLQSTWRLHCRRHSGNYAFITLPESLPKVDNFINELLSTANYLRSATIFKIAGKIKTPRIRRVSITVFHLTMWISARLADNPSPREIGRITNSFLFFWVSGFRLEFWQPRH